MKRKLCQQRNTEIQSKTYITAEVFFLTCDQTFFVFFLRGGLDLITIQSNHLLGNLRYTLTERLLANLTDLRFRKNGFESHRSNSTASPDLALKIWSRQKSIMGYPRYFSSELCWKGKFQENTKSLESSSNFQN